MEAKDVYRIPLLVGLGFIITLGVGAIALLLIAIFILFGS